MMRRSPLLTLLPAATLAALLPSPAEADILTNHAAVYANSLGFTGYANIVGNGALTTGVVYGEGITNDTHQLVWGRSQASTSPTGQGLLKTRATAHGDPGPIPGVPYGGDSVSAAIWADIAFVEGIPPPNRIYAHVSVDGLLSVRADQGVFSDLASKVDVYFADFEVNLAPPFGPFPGGVAVALLGEEGFSVGGWESDSFSEGVFHGTLSLPLTYDPALGGYRFAVQLRTQALAVRGYADANFFNSLNLTGFTLTDGTPVAVTFDSGLQLGGGRGAEPVPEPSTLALLGGGVLSLLAVRRRRAADPEAPR